MRDRPAPGRRHRAASDDLTETDEATLVAALPSARLDVYVPFPNGEQTLLLTFTTTLPDPAREAMVLLFEAMAASLRWTAQE